MATVPCFIQSLFHISDPDTNMKLIDLAKKYLKDTSHSVKSKCLYLIGELLPLGDPSVPTTLHLINCYTHSQDARVSRIE
jgi:hypothetical protein